MMQRIKQWLPETGGTEEIRRCKSEDTMYQLKKMNESRELIYNMKVTVHKTVLY
jgi:hypothetical protein